MVSAAAQQRGPALWKLSVLGHITPSFTSLLSALLFFFFFFFLSFLLLLFSFLSSTSPDQKPIVVLRASVLPLDELHAQMCWHAMLLVAVLHRDFVAVSQENKKKRIA
jgi:hypothetical protein